jgi:phage tail sheath gpL-like
MTTILQPKVNVQIVPSSETVANTGQKILFVGQKVAAGSATAGALVENIANGGAEDALFGRDSMLATLIRANKVRNQQIQVDAIALDDNGSGVAATGTITVVGTATEAGTLTVIAGSERNHKFAVAVADTDTETTVAAAIVAAVNADLDVPVTAGNVAGVVTFTANNDGTYGNSIPIEVRGSVAGITGTAVVGMASGATDPVLTGVFDVIAEKRYQAIVWPYPNDTAEVRTLLDARFNADGRVLDGVAFTALNDTAGNLATLAGALNSESLVIIGGKTETETNYAGGDIVEIPMVKAAVFAGYRGLRLDEQGVSVSDLVITTNGPLDSFGGPALASKPYFNTPFAELLPIQTGRGFDDSEIETLTGTDGVSVLGNNIAGNTVISGEIVTTYKTDVAGNPDVTFGFLNFVDTASQSREYFFNNYRARFAQSRLTEGDVVKGRDMANATVVRSFSKRLYQDLSGVDFVLLEAGEDALLFFDANLVITIDKASGKVTIQMTVPIVTQLREIAATMKIAFSTNI